MALARIQVSRAARTAVTRGPAYRGDVVATDVLVTVRFRAFLWFDLFMVVMCGLPVALALAAAVGSVLALAAAIPLALYLYVLAAIVLNRVELRLEPRFITSRLWPFPIWPPKLIPIAGITHVVATQSILAGGWSESTNVSWYVVAFVGDEQRAITRQLRTREEAVFVARTIEEHLGLSASAHLDDDAS